MQLQHQLHILADGAAVVAAGRDHDVFSEHPESPGNDHGAVKLVQQDAGSQKGTVILQHLHTGQEVPGQTVLFHPPSGKLYIVGDTHQPADRHHIFVLQYRLSNLSQRIILQDRIGIHTDKIGVIGGIDAHIQRICLAAVFLANDGKRHF